MPLCSDEIFWGKIVSGNLPPRLSTTIRMKKLGDKVTNSMDLPSSLDGSGLWKFHRGTSAITGAGGKVGERVSVGQGCLRGHVTT